MEGLETRHTAYAKVVIALFYFQYRNLLLFFDALLKHYLLLTLKALINNFVPVSRPISVQLVFLTSPDEILLMRQEKMVEH
jgi:hypothetical protein